MALTDYSFVQVTEIKIVRAQHVYITEDSLTVDVDDGRTISVPLGWYPRLLHGTPEERNNWRLIGKKEKASIGLIFDVDISVENVLNEKPSGESQRSLKKWLEGRFSRE